MVLVEDPLEASPLCSKVALADSVEDPLEASPLCSKVALADSLAAGQAPQRLLKKVLHLATSLVKMFQTPGGGRTCERPFFMVGMEPGRESKI